MCNRSRNCRSHDIWTAQGSAGEWRLPRSRKISPDSWPAAPESSVARDDLGDGVAEDIGHAGEFPGARLPSSGPERVHGAHLEPCEADWRVVPESVRRDGHAAAGDRYVPGPDVLPVFREQATATHSGKPSSR